MLARKSCYQLGPQQSENQCREHGVLFEILGADLGGIGEIGVNEGCNAIKGEGKH